MATTPRRRPQALASLLLTVALAVGLGLLIYLSVASLPYLAVSPTTDPVFGSLNACVLEALKERTGFAPSRDATRLAAWNPATLVVCGPEETTPGQTLKLSGVTAGAWDGTGKLWVAQQSSDSSRPRLLRLEAQGLVDHGELPVQALTGTRDGVMVLEPGGALVSLNSSGDVVGTRQLPAGDMRAAQVSSSADGERVSVVIGGGVFTLNEKAELLRAEAPCVVEALWWLATPPHHAIVACRSDSPLALSLDVESGQTEPVDPRSRVRSTLVGPAGVWALACDVLPCSAEPP